MMPSTDNSAAAMKTKNVAAISISTPLTTENKIAGSTAVGKLLEIGNPPEVLGAADAANASAWNAIKPMSLIATPDALLSVSEKINGIAIPKSLAAMVAEFMILIINIMSSLQKSQFDSALSQLEQMANQIKAQITQLNEEMKKNLAKDMIQATFEMASAVVSIVSSSITIGNLKAYKASQQLTDTKLKEATDPAEIANLNRDTNSISAAANIANNKQQYYSAFAGLAKAFGPLIGGAVNNMAAANQIAAKDQELAQGITSNQLRITMDNIASLRDAINRMISSLQEVVSVDPNNSKASSQRM